MVLLVLALFTDDHPRAPAKFQRIGAVYDLSTVRQQLIVLGEVFRHETLLRYSVAI
jgi:hypothetical protein